MTTDTLTRPRRTQAERREESRRRMLDAALDLLAERRSIRFTLAEVGEKAGYSRGLPSQTFQTKAALISALANHILTRSDEETHPHQTRGEGLEAVLTTVRLLVIVSPEQMKIEHAVAVLLVEASTPDSPYREAVTSINQIVTGYISKHLRIAAAKGEIRPDIDFRAQAALIIAAVRGLVMLWQLEPERYDLKALWRELDETLRRTLAV
jgi:TetR/AcrR family acrAB operon transcriptional repressor